MNERIKSFKYAFNGLKILIQDEPNARIHAVAAAAVLIAGFAFNVSHFEWVSLILCIGIVFIAEILNSALENLADYVSPEKNELIKKVKDLAASAVLVSAVTALIIGLVIFIPKIGIL